jgi:threonine/homoserine/homoserine lactone efflux protein
VAKNARVLVDSLRGVNFSVLIAFVAVDLTLVLTPGADWAFAIAAGLRGRAVASVAGLAGGYALQAALVTAGVGTVLARSASALDVLTFAGAAYLLYLGIAVSRRPARVSAGSPAGLGWLRGATVSALNPKGLLLFFAVLPQFVVARGAWPATTQLAVLGSIHVVFCALVYLAVALGAARVLGSRPHAALLVGRLSGITMILVAVALMAERALSGP